MEEDMILPDDFQEAPPQAEETQEMQEEIVEESIELEAEDTTPADQLIEQEAQPEPTAPQTLKIKFNHEEREISVEEAALLAQKGMNYEKAVERAAQEARDAYIAEQGYTWNGKPVTTEAEYKQAMMEKEIMERYEGQVPEEIMQEIIESRRDREERAKEKQAKQEQEVRERQIGEFFDYFQSVHERAYDPNKDTIPQEVRDAFDKGTPLKVAYMEHHNRELRNQLKIAQQNASNRQKAPVGSVTAFGGTKADPEDDFLAGFNSI